MPYIKLVLSHTSKKAFSQDEHSIYYESTETFPDLDKAQDWLDSHFYYCKTKRPMYLEKTDGTYHQSGIIYCYNEKTYNRDGTIDYSNIQVWVSFYEVESKSVNFDTLPDTPVKKSLLKGIKQY